MRRRGPFDQEHGRPEETWPWRRHPHGPDDPMFHDRKRYERHIYLFRQQLMYDIEAQAGIISRVRRTEDGKEDNALTDITQQYRPMFDRWIDKYVNLAIGRMSAFVLEPFKQSKSDKIGSEDEIDIELQVPFSWDDTCFQPLVQAVHDYVVNGALYELMGLTLSPRDNVMNRKQMDLEQSYGDIKRFICAVKPGTVRKRYEPF